MMPCEDVRNLIEAHLTETLDEPTRQAMIRHLQTCPDCHRAVEEARLAAMVLKQAAPLPLPPPDLAQRIKAAAHTRLFYRKRPLHERALGSPGFLATCASLLCGALICLSAILKVGDVPPESAPPQVVAAPVQVHSLIAVETSNPAMEMHARMAATPPAPRLAEIRREGTAPRPHPRPSVPPARASAPPASLAALSPREASLERARLVRQAQRDLLRDVALRTPPPALQRISVPGVVGTPRTMIGGVRRSVAEDLPATTPDFKAIDLPGARAPRELEGSASR